MRRTTPAACLAACLFGAAAATACTKTPGSEPAAVRPAVAVTLDAACPADLTEAVDVVGSLAPKFFADVKSEVSGTVSAVYVTQWVAVRKGAPLARLETTEAEAGIAALKAAAAQARVAEVRARREHDRAVQLSEYGLITRQALDEASSALDAAEAASRAAAAQVRTGEARLTKSFFRSPMDGVVAERGVNVGDRVENVGSGASMFRIVDNRLLDLTVTVASADLPRVRPGQRLEFTTDGVPDRTFTGKVMFVNPAVDAVSRSARVNAEVPNTDGALRGGLFARGRILTEVRRDVIVIPREALLNWNVAARTADVFLVRDGVAHKRSIRVGLVDVSRVQAVEGIADGDRVVTRGGFALKDGDAVAVSAAPKS